MKKLGVLKPKKLQYIKSAKMSVGFESLGSMIVIDQKTIEIRTKTC
jgi:hypothetical protein